LRAPSRLNVRFGSKADSCGAKWHVRFTPNSDRKSGHPQKVMSALPLNLLQNYFEQVARATLIQD